MRRSLGGSAGLFAALLCLTGLTGCGGGGGAQSPLDGPDPTALSASVTTPGGLTAMLVQGKASTSTGTPLTYTLTLANPTAQAVTVQAAGGLNDQGQYDLSKVSPYVGFHIADASGKWVYPDPNAAQPAIGFAPITILLPAGRVISTNITVPGGLSPSGKYQASANFLISGSGTTGEVDTPVGPLTVSFR